MKKKKKIDDYSDFMKNNFVVCPFCHYNNKYETFIRFGTCLRCLEVIDDRIYFRNTLGITIRKLKYKEKR